jgi:hypothetical protein
MENSAPTPDCRADVEFLAEFLKSRPRNTREVLKRNLALLRQLHEFKQKTQEVFNNTQTVQSQHENEENRGN